MHWNTWRSLQAVKSSPWGERVPGGKGSRYSYSPSKLYSDYIGCAGTAALGALTGNDSGPWLVMLHVALFGSRMSIGAAGGIAYITDLAVATKIRETCVAQTYGPGYF
jgi:hypothetical protein